MLFNSLAANNKSAKDCFFWLIPIREATDIFHLFASPFCFKLEVVISVHCSSSENAIPLKAIVFIWER